MPHRSFDEIFKAEPGVGDVHVSAALGNGKKKPRLFDRVISTIAPIESAVVGKNGRRLTLRDDGSANVPFPYNHAFFSLLKREQLPEFLRALTHRGELKKKTVRLDKLQAIQDRVNPANVLDHRGRLSKKLPVVVKLNEVSYIGDGHSRLTAWWLNGADTAQVRMADLGSRSILAFKRLAESRITFEMKKADPDQRLIFGWASVVTKDGRPIVDHQNDVIPVDELEKAFYDYVLSARQHGHMHSNIGTGRLVECMVFTKQKQDLLGIDLGFEGAWVGYLVDDERVWASHKRGELPEFSIGGMAVPVLTEMQVG